ncbi:MAG: ABC transporter permease [Vicinamibacterales bacterium]
MTPADHDAHAAPWTTVITPSRGWLDWRLRELWRYRDLVALFVWRDFTSVYKQTILGPLWHVIQPLLATLTFMGFGSVTGLSTDGTPKFLFYLSGTVLWTYFAATLTQTSYALVVNANLLGKVYFHRLVIPVSIALSNMITFGIQFAIFLIALGYYRLSGADVHFTTWAFVTPLCLLILAGYGLGCGIIVAAMTTRYRDLGRLVTFGVQLFMFVTPVIYPLSTVPAALQPIARLNPLVPIIEGCRKGFLGAGTVTPQDLTASAGVMLVILVIGVMLFTHIERTFADTV